MEKIPSPGEILKEALVQRQSKRGYSLRSFARHLGVSPAFLSQVVKNKRQISLRRAQQIASRLEDTEAIGQNFLYSVIASKTTPELPLSVSNSKKPRERFHEIPLSVFVKVNEWYHAALGELTQLDSFESNPQWIAKRLGLSLSQATNAINDLITAGKLKWKDEKLVSTQSHTRISGAIGIPSRILREFHLAMMKRAERSIRMESTKERVFGGIVVAIDPDKLEEANERMKKFRAEMAEFLGGGKKTSVYYLSMQLFRLDKDLEK